MVRMYLAKADDGSTFQRFEAQSDSEALRRARLFARRLTVTREDGARVGVVEKDD